MEDNRINISPIEYNRLIVKSVRMDIVEELLRMMADDKFMTVEDAIYQIVIGCTKDELIGTKKEDEE